ncbi:malate dehydrogenase [Aliarcobacter butzleri]|uniref:malate dehydrogenase n=1 Tax=Aliarcobacter butzleri TaxID=28197 RepID=UPI0021B3C44C|nr:malate dehydrogenase [Aliarcobacter butzleri]MCT7547342.1 malate dehydrogenase [Aliarcobacter butzleri]
MNNKTIGIIGVGNVGSTLAFILATNNICSNILLKDIKNNISQAMTLDISQAMQETNSNTKITACLNNEDFKDCDIIIITAGIARKPNMSRDDLLITNAKIVASVMNDISKNNPNAIIIIISNPLDSMVYTALKSSNYPKNKILGMAGTLDSTRMSYFIAEKLGFPNVNIKTSVIGGHGDSMVPLIDFSTVDGKKLNKVLSKEDIDDIVIKTKNGGGQIVKLLETGSAYYAPAYSTIAMIEAILNDAKKCFACATMLNGEYGYKDIVSGVPVILGKDGVEKIIELEISDFEKEQFAKSINSVKESINILENNFFN